MKISLFLLRVFAGLFMLSFHGWEKFTNYSTYLNFFPDPLGLGVATSLILVIFAEVFCSLLLIFGVATRFASIPLIITMFVAAFIVHADDPISKIELPLMYLTIYIILLIGGSGKYRLKLPFSSKNNALNWFIEG